MSTLARPTRASAQQEDPVPGRLDVGRGGQKRQPDPGCALKQASERDTSRWAAVRTDDQREESAELSTRPLHRQSARQPEASRLNQASLAGLLRDPVEDVADPDRTVAN